MPTKEQLRDRLLNKLKELFQLDEPDLDFGFYRIMHAKSTQVQEFIDNDLLKMVADAFGTADEARKAELQASYEKAVQTAKDFGAPNPEETEPVKKARAALDALKDTAAAEADVYDHLHRFFERYYDEGDFISRRYHSRETAGKAAPFAIPYNGEEVKLHWANADQYYIKTAEYFSNYSFDLTQAAEIRRMSPEERALNQIQEQPVKVHFHIVDASEGEHGNVKASEGQKRFFIIHEKTPLEVSADGELVVNFEYRIDPEKGSTQEGTWRDKRNGEAVSIVLTKLEELTKNDKSLDQYLRLLQTAAPTDKDKSRPLLAKYVYQYTARNTCDYFIHKDLGGFLRRELDFYIKNEVMRLDDIENADVPAVESYLSKIRVLRKIAGKLIDFLAQLENFQKKLWLKKKFVVETNYCITLDRVPEQLYEEIAENEEQHDEWVKLYAINEIERDLTNPGYAKPLTVDFLHANNTLVLDTRFFDDDFKARLVASIENIDEQCDGLLIHSENFQALNLIRALYLEQVKCVYIDPPYNTGGDDFLYKDSYKDSSWLSSVFSSSQCAYDLMSGNAVFYSSIGDKDEQNRETFYYGNLLDSVFGKENWVDNLIVCKSNNGMGSREGFSTNHEYILTYKKNKSAKNAFVGLLPDESYLASFDKEDQFGKYKIDGLLRKKGAGARRQDSPNCFYPIYYHPATGTCSLIELADYFEIIPKLPSGTDGRWTWSRDYATDKMYRLHAGSKGTIYIKDYLTPERREKPKSILSDSKYLTDCATGEIKSLFTEKDFPTPKPTELILDIIDNASYANSLILDHFAGSGCTAHAVINLNRKDSGQRKFILIEMGNHFDTVLKPRVAKVVYSETWKDGKPTARNSGISHCSKYLRLESYEDTLNNLRFDEAPARDKAVAANPALKEDFMLRYLLDVETRGSQSLLNIDAFADPTAYALKVKKPGSDESVTRSVDLIETFNYLIV